MRLSFGSYRQNVIGLLGAGLALIAGLFFLLGAPASATVPGTPGKILYTKQTEDGQKAWIMEPDGSQNRLLFPDNNEEPDAAWSPDASMIAYDNGIGSLYSAIYIRKVDGSPPITLTNIGTQPAWSPDGKKIAFIYLTNVWTINIDGTGLQEVTHGGAVVRPTWSPDGAQIAFTSARSGGGGLYLVNADGTNEHAVFTDASGNMQLVFSGIMNWSPDSTRLAITTNTDLTILTLTDRQSTFTHNPRNIIMHAVNVGLSSIDGVSWSPDGSRLAFRGCCSYAQTSQIYVSDTAGTPSSIVQLTYDTPFEVIGNARFQANWLPDWGVVSCDLPSNMLGATTLSTIANNACNNAPTVIAGPPVKGTIKRALSISAAVTDDGLPNPPAQITQQWTVDVHPANGVVAFGDATAASTTATFTVPGHYELRLTASDSAKSTSVVIPADIDDLPVADFTQDIVPGGAVTFDASASKAGGSTATITKYNWEFEENGIKTSVQPAKTEHSYKMLNPTDKLIYTVKLSVTDSNGNTSDPVSHDIDLCAPDENAVTALQFTGLVHCMENALNNPPPRTMLSTLRKYYYGNEIWSLSQNIVWNLVIPCSVEVSDPNPSMNAKLQAALKSSQQTLDGDVGHVFTGQEAFHCLNDNVAFMGVDNLGWATWIGDVGSAVEGKVLHDLRTGATSSWGDYIGQPNNGLANSFDLNGDLDAVVLQYALANSSCYLPPSNVQNVTLDRPMSQILYSYYNADAASGLGSYYAQRGRCYRGFLQPTNSGQLDFKYMDKQYSSEVENFADMFLDKAVGLDLKTQKEARKLIKKYTSEAIVYFTNWANNQ